MIDWLLDSDPAIRWQVIWDLTGVPAADVAAERSKVAENPHDDDLDFDMSEREGQPSRWNTLRALRVLRWYERRR